MLDDNIKDLVKNWILENDRQGIIEKYGSIEDWDTSQVTNMNQLFFEAYSFNRDISKWDVSNISVINMDSMFSEAPVSKNHQPKF